MAKFQRKVAQMWTKGALVFPSIQTPTFFRRKHSQGGAAPSPKAHSRPALRLWDVQVLCCVRPTAATQAPTSLGLILPSGSTLEKRRLQSVLS